jgi:hypothetical protein
MAAPTIIERLYQRGFILVAKLHVPDIISATGVMKLVSPTHRGTASKCRFLANFTFPSLFAPHAKFFS